MTHAPLSKVDEGEEVETVVKEDQDGEKGEEAQGQTRKPPHKEKHEVAEGDKEPQQQHPVKTLTMMNNKDN